MNLSIIAGSYIASIDYIIHKTINASFLGCYLNSFDNTFKVDCFKSYALTQLLCINFCSLRGMCNNSEIQLAENTNTHIILLQAYILQKCSQESRSERTSMLILLPYIIF